SRSDGPPTRRRSPRRSSSSPPIAPATSTAPSSPSTGAASPASAAQSRLRPSDAIAHVRRQRRVDDLHRLEAGVRDAVEDALSAAEQDGGEVEDQLVDHARGERLAHGGSTSGDVDSAVAGGLFRAREGGVEPVGDEVERRSALELDRLVLVVREDEDRSVVRRL